MVFSRVMFKDLTGQGVEKKKNKKNKKNLNESFRPTMR